MPDGLQQRVIHRVKLLIDLSNALITSLNSTDCILLLADQFVKVLVELKANQSGDLLHEDDLVALLDVCADSSGWVQ